MKVAIHLMLLLLSLLLLPALHAGLYLNSLKLPECPAKFIKDLAFGKDGAIWVATEDNDIWQLPDYAKSKTWIQHTPFADTPITHNYNTVCVDDKGLVWVGSDRRGLAVWNGQTWKSYDRFNGPFGERVLDIQCSTLGTIAVAHNVGPSLYFPDRQSWQHLSIADGLPEWTVKSIAFAPDETLYAAFPSAGIAISSAHDQYRKCLKIYSP